MKNFKGYYIEDKDSKALVISDGIYMIELNGEFSKEAFIEIADTLKIKDK